MQPCSARRATHTTHASGTIYGVAVDELLSDFLAGVVDADSDEVELDDPESLLFPESPFPPVDDVALGDVDDDLPRLSVL